MKDYLLTQLTFPRLANSRRSNNDNDADDDTSGDNSVKAYRKSVSKSKREHNMRNKDVYKFYNLNISSNSSVAYMDDSILE
ncbi:hypothetical protein T05_1285 [Trichinella murrelli]|uniref:Uncharacterized protein n=1 Tax=Trichinella murrelli TaxID=144512 RepID=A0A0V0TBM4_9BILA|nr:hypothetical protein T05_1285 [Trichinella murrelli]